MMPGVTSLGKLFLKLEVLDNFFWSLKTIFYWQGLEPIIEDLLVNTQLRNPHNLTAIVIYGFFV